MANGRNSLIITQEIQAVLDDLDTVRPLDTIQREINEVEGHDEHTNIRLGSPESQTVQTSGQSIQ